MNFNGAAHSRILTIPLFSDVVINSVNNSPKAIELPTRALDGVLHQCSQLQLITMAKGQTANMRWDVEVVPGFDREHEASDFSLTGIAFVSANGPLRHTAITTTANFLLTGRLRIVYKNDATTTTPESAIISAVLLAYLIGA